MFSSAVGSVPLSVVGWFAYKKYPKIFKQITNIFIYQLKAELLKQGNLYLKGA
jgi:hypothetical protein